MSPAEVFTTSELMSLESGLDQEPNSSSCPPSTTSRWTESTEIGREVVSEDNPIRDSNRVKPQNEKNR